jgi:hypothetical protein
LCDPRAFRLCDLSAGERCAVIVLRGRIVKGLGSAARVLPLQAPLLARLFPQIARLHLATINVLLESPLRIEKPDIVTDPIDWRDREVVHITQARFQPVRLTQTGYQPGTPCDAWIYSPQHSVHRANPYHVEIMAPKLDLTDTPMCLLTIDRPAWQIPMIVIGQPAQQKAS